MTNEALEQGQEIMREIKRLKEIKESITPYRNEIVYLDITVKKGQLGCALNDEGQHYHLMTDNPLFLSIASALQDMIDDLQNQFDNLGVNEKTKTNHIQSTYLWKKIWNKRG